MRVLMVALSGIGNLLMQSPMWVAIKRTHPSAEITLLLANRGTTDVVRGNPRIHGVIQGTPRPTFTQYRQMIRDIRRSQFDVGMVAFPGQLYMSSSLLAFGGIPQRIGHRYALPFLQRSGLFLTHPVDEQPLHDLEQNIALLKPLGIPTDPQTSAYDFPLSADDEHAGTAFLQKNGLTETPLIGFHPGSHPDLAFKRWPTERWAELGTQLAETHHATILLFAGPGEERVCTEIQSTLRGPSQSILLPLRTAAAVMKRCRFFVSNDSGLMHVAVSHNVQTFGLFGPTDERRTAPWGSYGHVIRAAGTHSSYSLNHVITEPQTEPAASMRALLVDTVAATIASVLQGT